MISSLLKSREKNRKESCDIVEEKKHLHNYRNYLMPAFLVLLDVVIVACAAMLTLWLRLPDGGSAADSHYTQYLATLLNALPALVVLHTLCGLGFHIHNRMWRYAGYADLFAILLANVCGMLTFYGYAKLMGVDLPRSFYPGTFLVALFLTYASRLLLRYFINHNQYKNAGEKDRKNVLIVGAGNAGSIMLRDLRQQPELYHVVGYIDDDPAKQGQILNGIKVLGNRTAIPQVVERQNVHEIMITMPRVSPDEIRQIADVCSKTRCEVRILPSFYTQLGSGRIGVQDLRPISIEDLLERKPITLNLEKIGEYLTGRVVLVTGAGGSIGSELCRQVLRRKPAKLILLGRGENSIYEIHRELCTPTPMGTPDEIAADAAWRRSVLKPVIMNITNHDGLQEIFEKYHPQVVFHAAAHKHVPLMEAQPEEAIFNNVRGSWNVMELAGQYGAQRVVVISTDKAVNPTSVMGATKRITERTAQAMNKKYPHTNYVAVRFGNVLGSRGSVVPLFKRQIAAGGPVTVTHPDMRRYFMTIPEASQLVLEAANMGTGGEVFVLDMGQPVKIVDLARNMILLSGKRPDEDIEIKYTGLRPGEKLFEELLTAEEGTVSTSNDRIFRAILNDEDPAQLEPELEHLIALKDMDECIAQLQQMIPTYTPNHFGV